jgi:hypothetical protein
MNNDGIVELADVVLLINYLYKSGSVPQDAQRFLPQPWRSKSERSSLFLNANGKIREAQMAQQLLLADKRNQLELQKLKERNDHAERIRGLTQDQNTKMWGTVNSALDRMSRDPDYIKKMERLDNEVSDAELAAKQEPTGWFPADPYKAEDASGTEQNYLDKPSYLKWQQAKKRRDTEYSKHLDEEEALVNTLPASAGTLKQSQLDMIAKQRAGLMLDTPPKKDGWVEKPAAGKDVPSNKYTQDKPAKPTSKEEYDKLPPNSYYLQDGVVKRKKG